MLGQTGLEHGFVVLTRIGLVALLATALALTGCGRRGPLEPPPGAAPDLPKTAPVPAKPAGGDKPSGLFRNTSTKAEDPVSGAPEAKKSRGSTPFVLDPLL